MSLTSVFFLAVVAVMKADLAIVHQSLRNRKTKATGVGSTSGEKSSKAPVASGEIGKVSANVDTELQHESAEKREAELQLNFEEEEEEDPSAQLVHRKRKRSDESSGHHGHHSHKKKS